MRNKIILIGLLILWAVLLVGCDAHTTEEYAGEGRGACVVNVTPNGGTACQFQFPNGQMCVALVTGYGAGLTCGPYR